MRKVSSQITAAFLAGNKQAVGNSRTDGDNLYLHGNLIAWKKVVPSDQGICIEYYATLAGWNTPTTRERLNALIQKLGIPGYPGFFQKNFGAFYGWDNHNKQKAITAKDSVRICVTSAAGAMLNAEPAFPDTNNAE